MNETIETGYMVFLAEGAEGIGAVREIVDGAIVVYVENGGEFLVAYEAIKAVHDHKVILTPGLVDRRLLEAVGHAHDAEDPKLVG